MFISHVPPQNLGFKICLKLMKDWFFWETINHSDGCITLRMQDGRNLLLQQVRYVIELMRNLISLGTLDSNSYVIKSENGMLKVSIGSLVIMKAIRKQSLYILQGRTIVGGTAIVQNMLNKTNVWHLRLGHSSERKLAELTKQNLLCGDKIQILDLYEYCILRKSKRVHFSERTHTTKKPFEYAHFDILDPSKTETHGWGS